MGDLSKSSDLVTHTYKVNVQLEQVFSYLKDAETGQRGFIITNNPIYLDPYEAGRENINNCFVELRELTKDNPVQQANLKELNSLIDIRMAYFEKSFRFSAVSNLEDSNFKQYFLEGKMAMDDVRDKVEEMMGLENSLLENQKNDLQKNLKFTPIFLYLVLLMSLLLMYLAYSKVISNLKRLKAANAELEIFKESANLSEIVSHHGNWVWHIDDNRFVYSDNFYRLLGEEPQSFKPTIENFMAFVHPKDRKKLSKAFKKMIDLKDLPYVNYRVIRKNGDIRHLKAYGKTLSDDEGSKQLLGTSTDITDEINNLKKLAERNLELERNNKELSAFNHVASHDLQEPLRKIQTFLSRLEEKEAQTLSASGLVYMERIKSAATRMRLLIDDLLQFSRSNKADKVFEKSSLNVLLEKAKQDLAEVITKDNVSIQAESIPEINVIPFQIQQLFVNLIGNSIKYSSADRSTQIKITYEKIRASEDPHIKKAKKVFYHKIAFSDNGIGFDNTYAEKIFVLFNRLHNKDEYSGTGIGLSICKKIIENHNGYILAHGIPNVGATFTIYLPIKY
ncbi:CHASE3 domain-containing protein [Mariniflexile ostreae]|uniref:histidine kinase n=2 Tax=Mariniflexile ostreae TaxID=1520892 RepID=A0ABV5FD82_9FLAO